MSLGATLGYLRLGGRVTGGRQQKGPSSRSQGRMAGEIQAEKEGRGYIGTAESGLRTTEQ